MVFLRGLRGTVFLGALLVAVLPAPAREREEGPDKPSDAEILGGLVSMRAERSEFTREEVRLSGYADVSTAGGARIQADEVHYRKETGLLTAEGGVVLDWPGVRVMGSRLEYRIESETGTLVDVHGYLEPDLILTADRVEKIAADRIRVERAEFTSCTQPTPYWSFRVKSGIFHLKHYAYLRSLTMRVRGAPVFYTPYLVWPIKERRATGFLFPQFGQSDNLGLLVSLPLFVAIGDHADLTFFFDGYTKVGPAVGTEFNWLPTRRGAILAQGYFINDRVKEKDRYKLGWLQRQRFGEGWRLRANLNFVSDFDYYTDYERDLQAASTPETVSTVGLTKNWDYYSLNARAEDREQFFVGGPEIQRTLTGELDQRLFPEVEVRGRSRRIVGPLFLSFEASASRFEKDSIEYPPAPATRFDAVWERVDLLPELKIPWSPVPWLDIEPSITLRQTWYSKRRDPDAEEAARRKGLALVPVGTGNLLRSLFQFSLEIQGPKMVRVWETPKSRFSPGYKHAIEPFIRYSYAPEPSQETEEILRFDEIDAVPGESNLVAYGIRQRLFAKRPAQVGSRPMEDDQKPVGFGREEEGPDPEEEGEMRRLKETPVSERLNPVEIASLTISQRFSFLPESVLSSSFAVRVDGNGDPLVSPTTGRPQTEVLETRRYSPVDLQLRFNPSYLSTVDARYTYEPLVDRFTSRSISASVRAPDRGYLRLSWFRTDPADLGREETDQARVFAGIQGFNRKVGLEWNWNYDIEQEMMQDQSYRLRYYTQCCGFVVEYLKRDFLENEREEIRLVVDLKGIGRFLDLHQGFGGAPP